MTTPYMHLLYDREAVPTDDEEVATLDAPPILAGGLTLTVKGNGTLVGYTSVTLR